MRRRKRRFRNAWIAIRASPGGASTRHASRGVVSGRGAHRSEEQSDPGVGANRQPAGSTEGPRLRLGLCVWRGLPSGGQSSSLLSGCLLMSMQSRAWGNETGRITILEENDSLYFNSDKHYTQGLRISDLGSPWR